LALAKQWAEKGIGGTAGWATVIVEQPGIWSVFDWNKRYGVEKLFEIKKDLKACASCNFGCRVAYEVRGGQFDGLQTESGHYLLPAIKGQSLELEDQRDAIKLLDMANRAGMCFFTTGALVDWVTRSVPGMYQ
jgi:aldehyde:ferredoxin oxidoreductase